jgi:hypothetical protein
LSAASSSFVELTSAACYFTTELDLLPSKSSPHLNLSSSPDQPPQPIYYPVRVRKD